MFEIAVSRLRASRGHGEVLFEHERPQPGLPGQGLSLRLRRKLEVTCSICGRQWLQAGGLARVRVLGKGSNMARSINRSANTGRFVSKAAVARWPGKTTTERVGSGTGNSRTVNRSASTGKFVTDATVRRNPGGTIQQKV
jgi:hypothetical protein